MIPLNNNLSENALRAVAIGRKNWMFAGNDMAAQCYAALLSLLTTAVANGLKPKQLLKTTLMALDDVKISDLDDLLPLALPERAHFGLGPVEAAGEVSPSRTGEVRWPDDGRLSTNAVPHINRRVTLTQPAL